MENQDIKYIVGIELGSSRAKIGVAGYPVAPDGQPAGPLTVYNVASRPTTHAVRYGRINNVKDVTETINSLLNDIETQYPVKGRKVIGVYIGVGGRSLKSTVKSARLELPERREISEDLIVRLKEDVAVQIPREREILAIESVGFKVDNIPTPRPVGTLGTRLEGEFTVVTCDPANVGDFRSVLVDRVGLGVCAPSVRPLAIAGMVLSPNEAFSGCMLVDIGAETITVSIYKGGSLRYLATIPLGTRLITLDLSRELSLPENEAEDVKIKLGSAIGEPDSDEDRQIVDGIIGSRLNEIIANICAQPGFAGVTPADLPAGIILVGGGAKLRKFDRLLESISEMKVRMASVPGDLVFADKALATFDNLDLFALLLESAFISANPDMPDCLTPRPEIVRPEKSVTPPAAADVKKKQPEKRVETKEEDPEDEGWDHPGYTSGHSSFGYDESDDILNDDPDNFSPDECGPDDEIDDDEGLLLDSDEEEKQRQLFRDQQRRLADQMRREEEKKKELAEKSGRPSRLDRFKAKVANFIGKNTSGDGEGADLDD